MTVIKDGGNCHQIIPILPLMTMMRMIDDISDSGEDDDDLHDSEEDGDADILYTQGAARCDGRFQCSGRQVNFLFQ